MIKTPDQKLLDVNGSVDLPGLSKTLESAVSKVNARLAYLFRNADVEAALDGLTPEKVKIEFLEAIRPFRLWLISKSASILRGFDLDSKLATAIEQTITASLAWREAKDEAAEVFTPWNVDEIFTMVAELLTEQERAMPERSVNSKSSTDTASAIAEVQELFIKNVKDARDYVRPEFSDEIITEIVRQLLAKLEPFRLWVIENSPDFNLALDVDQFFQSIVKTHVRDAYNSTEDLSTNGWPLDLSRLLHFVKLAKDDATGTGKQ